MPKKIIIGKAKRPAVEYIAANARRGKSQLPAVNHVGPGGRALEVDPERKNSNLHRLKRIEGQIRGLHEMVRQDRYCADILIQIAAVQKSLASVGRQVLGNHLKHCVSHGIRAGGAAADAACEELLKLVSHIDR